MKPWNMRTWTAAIVILAPLAANSQTLDDFFDGSKLQEIRLTMKPADWVLLKQNYMADTYYRGDFEWNGIHISNTGIKSRGSTSRNGIKPALGVHFAAYNPWQRFLGLESIVLRNFAQDASMVRERVTMEMFQKLGLPFEREVHAKVFINDAYVGLFAVVEPLDERFTLTRFSETNGYLYEYKWNGGSFYFNYLGDDPALYVPGLFEAKNNENAPQTEKIMSMIWAANYSSDIDFQTAMEKYIDLGSFVTHVAAEQFMAEGDGIVSTLGMRNFYLYRRLSDDRFVFLVWDKDRTFSMPDFDIFRGTDQNVLMRRALALPEIRQRYLEALLEAAQIAGGAGGWLEQEVVRIFQQIHSAVVEDPSRVCEIRGSGYIPCPLDWFEAEAAYVTDFAKQRSDIVKSAISAAGMSVSHAVLMPGAAMNPASLVPQLVAGSLARIDVPLSVSVITAADTLPLPPELAGVSMGIGGRAAPIANVSPSGAVVQVPWAIVCGPAAITIKDHGVATNTISVEIRPSSPGIFAITHADGTLVDTARPARPGEAVIVHATGLGAPVVPQTDGGLPSGAVILRNEVGAFVDGVPVAVAWAGLSPSFVGLQQVDIEIPNAVPSSDTVELRLMMFGEMGPPFPIAVRQAEFRSRRDKVYSELAATTGLNE